MFAIHDAESLGFSPAELVFGHSVRGPLKILQERFLSPGPVKILARNALDYVSSFFEHLYTACELVKDFLASSQSCMKTHFD